MLVQHSIHVDRPIEAVGAALAAGPRKWFPRTGFWKKLMIEVGEPVTAGDWIEVPVTWQATFIKKLYPVMSGTVELSPVDRGTTRLTVCGAYEPPARDPGEPVAHVLIHEAAEAAVKELAESIARRLELRY